MKNVKVQKDGDTLTLIIDLGQDNGPSKSGKTTIVATTGGNVDLGEGFRLGVNCYKSRSPSVGSPDAF